MQATSTSGMRYDILNPAFYADPHPVLHRMRAADPVYWHTELEAWILTRYRDIETVLRDERASSARVEQLGKGAPPHVRDRLDAYVRFLSSWPLFRDKPGHPPLRAALARAMAPIGEEASLNDFMDRMVEDAVARAEQLGEVDFVSHFAYPVPTAVIAKILGIPQEDAPRFKHWTTEIFKLIGAGLATEESVERGYQGVVALQQYTRELIARRRSKREDDLISRLLAETESGIVSDDDIVASAALMVVAGHETTTSLLATALFALLRHPDQLEAVRADPSLVDGVFDEALRYEGPVFSLIRRAADDMSVGGRTIRKGQYVFSMLCAGNRDPAHFTDPDRFDARRREQGHLAFGLGAHFCIGVRLARVVTRCVLSRVIRLPHLRLASDDVRWEPNISFRALCRLPITLRGGG
jgi:hypothetical protein